MRNDKGQVLVAFVLLLPLLFLLIGIVIDLGYFYQAKRKMNHTIQDAITYGLNLEISEEEIKTKVTDEIKDNVSHLTSLLVSTSSGQIRVTVTSEIDPVFSFLTSKKKQEVSSGYRGYKIDGKIKLVKE